MMAFNLNVTKCETFSFETTEDFIKAIDDYYLTSDFRIKTDLLQNKTNSHFLFLLEKNLLFVADGKIVGFYGDTLKFKELFLKNPDDFNLIFLRLRWNDKNDLFLHTLPSTLQYLVLIYFDVENYAFLNHLPNLKYFDHRRSLLSFSTLFEKINPCPSIEQLVLDEVENCSQDSKLGEFDCDFRLFPNLRSLTINEMYVLNKTLLEVKTLEYLKLWSGVFYRDGDHAVSCLPQTLKYLTSSMPTEVFDQIYERCLNIKIDTQFF